MNWRREIMNTILTIACLLAMFILSMVVYTIAGKIGAILFLIICFIGAVKLFRYLNND